MTRQPTSPSRNSDSDARTGEGGTYLLNNCCCRKIIRDLSTSSPDSGNFIHLMTLRFFIFAAIIVASVTVSSISAAALEQGRADTSTIAQVLSVLRAQQKAWNHGDVNGFMNGYARSKSAIFVSEDTVTRGWQTVRARYRKKYSDRAKMGVLTFSDLEITPVGPDAAVVLGRWKLKRTQDQPHGRFTLILRRLPEGWRIVHDHTSAAASN